MKVPAKCPVELLNVNSRRAVNNKFCTNLLEQDQNRTLISRFCRGGSIRLGWITGLVGVIRLFPVDENMMQWKYYTTDPSYTGEPKRKMIISTPLKEWALGTPSHRRPCRWVPNDRLLRPREWAGQLLYSASNIVRATSSHTVQSNTK